MESHPNVGDDVTATGGSGGMDNFASRAPQSRRRKGREDATVMWRWPGTYDPLIVYLPKTWLLREGWLKHGRIGFGEVPSSPPMN